MCSFLTPDSPSPPRVRACSTLRHGAGASPAPFDDFNLGLRCGDEPANARENRRALRELLALPAEPAWLQQVHGAGVLRVDGPPWHVDEPVADASVTGKSGVVLAILTADCLPVLFCDMAGEEVAAAHAGWRGLAGGVLEATVAAMQAAPGSLMAWLGPAAGPASYEIGEDVRSAFVDADSGAAVAFAETRPGHWRVDLPMLARRRLRAVGVQAVYGGSFDTIGDPARFFSHRRDGVSGRMASLVWLGSD